MKKLIIILIVLAVALFLYTIFRSSEEAYKLLPGADEEVVQPPEYAGWIDYQAPSGLFQVEFPLAPQSSTDVTRNDAGVVERTNELYASELENGTIYLISFVRYHTNGGKLPLSDEQMMSNVMYEMVDAKEGNQLIGFRKNQVAGKPGLRFTMVNGQVQVETEVFVNKNDLFIVSYIAHLQFFNEEDFKHFVQSIRLN